MKEVEEEWSETAWLTPPTLLFSFPPPPIPETAMFERAEGLINHCKWQCRRMVEGGDEANHYAYKSCAERYLKWPNVRKKCTVHVLNHPCVQDSASFNSAVQGTCEMVSFFLASDYFYPHIKPSYCGPCLFWNNHHPENSTIRGRDALLSIQSLPVDLTPSHSLSIAPLLAALLCLHFYCSLSLTLSLFLSHSLFHCHLANS